MKVKDKIINKVLNEFQTNRGRASCYCFDDKLITDIVGNVLIKFVAKHTNSSIFIVVDCYNTRQSIIKYINDNNIIIDNLKILSLDYVSSKYRYVNDLIISIGVSSFNYINKFYSESKYTLCILKEHINDIIQITNIRDILPSIDIVELVNNNKLENIYSPVEEHRHGVDFTIDNKELYDKYTDYINTSIVIFGELSNIEKCKHGDIVLGISSAEYRNTIAKENGWREDLDTSVPFMKEIDDVYNPNVLYERAINFYNIAKKRRDLVDSAVEKLSIVEDICNVNKNKRILIISKKGDFAQQITEYLQSKDIRCASYHDDIPNCVMLDENGNAKVYKTGKNKGSIRELGAQAQSTLNEMLFNVGQINVLSIKFSSNTKLKIACDIVILTTSLYDDIVDIKKRYSNIQFVNNPTIVYKLYCNNTIETAKFNKQNNPLVTIINETENCIEYDKNSGDIIL